MSNEPEKRNGPDMPEHTLQWAHDANGIPRWVSTTSAYEPCSRCRGSGMQDYGSSIGSCSTCFGDGYVRARDARGRFTRVTINV